MKNTIGNIIDEFNDTVGKEKGIIVNVTSISSSATLQEKLFMAANDEPNAPNLPDITTLYPNTALMLAEMGLLTDIETLFTEEELSDYVQKYIEEGRLLDGGLYVFPIAKSTEVIFLNTNIFNRFIKDTDASYENLKTFEGIIEIAEKYYNWTDSLTPDIKNDGKTFIVYDSLFNISQIGFQQLNDSFIVNEELNLDSPSYNHLWNIFYEPAVKGYVANYEGYGSDLMKTGNVAASIGSTAGVLFYSPIITYEDNITETVEYLVLPYPTFKNGQKVAIQRGGGISIIKSNESREQAAAEFLKWFTAPEQNLKFVSSTGYLPVTNEAFNAVMSDNGIVKDDNIKKLIKTVRDMQEQYFFIIPPTFAKFEELQSKYEKKLKETVSLSRIEYLKLLDSMDEDEAYNEVSNGIYENFIDQMR